ncbi:MAG: hypothetical protein KAW56_03210 [Candidatus Marinimicrobia bacterium]|nr:hypothetical protein [Candidatus Neomarinimicrobiota bacterium]
MNSEINPVHLFSLDTVLKKDKLELERLLKFASLCNLRIGENDNRLLDNSCYVNFFEKISGARAFLENLIKEKCLIVIKDPKHDTFKDALKDRLERFRKEKYIFSSLSNNDVRWLRRNKPNIDEFLNKFDNYSHWIEFLDEQPIKKFDYQFKPEDFPNLLKTRYQELENNLNLHAIYIIRPYLEKNEIFSRSDIYTHVDKYKKFYSDNFLDSIKRILIDDPYQVNLCEKNNLKPLIQEYNAKRLTQIFKNPAQEVEKLKSKITTKEIKSLYIPLNELNFEDILQIRDDIDKYLREKEKSNPQNYERNASKYEDALSDALIQCFDRKGKSSMVYKENKTITHVIDGITVSSTFFIGTYWGLYLADQIGRLLGRGFWGSIAVTGGVAFGIGLSFYAKDTFSKRKSVEWTNFEQILGKTMDISAADSFQENEQRGSSK